MCLLLSNQVIQKKAFVISARFTVVRFIVSLLSQKLLWF